MPSKIINPCISTALLILALSCNTSFPNDTIEILPAYEDLQTIMQADPDKVWVVNFWATSCPPCVKEMPHFAELDTEYGDDKVRVLLVSLDKPEDLESRVYPFIEKYKITPEVMILGDQNYSAWTDEVDPSWYGALPATLIVDGDRRAFRFGAYATYEELKSDLNSVLE